MLKSLYSRQNYVHCHLLSTSQHSNRLSDNMIKSMDLLKINHHTILPWSIWPYSFTAINLISSRRTGDLKYDVVVLCCMVDGFVLSLRPRQRHWGALAKLLWVSPMGTALCIACDMMAQAFMLRRIRSFRPSQPAWTNRSKHGNCLIVGIMLVLRRHAAGGSSYTGVTGRWQSH